MNYTKKPVTIQAWQLNLKDPKNIIQMYELVNNVDVSTLQRLPNHTFRARFADMVAYQ